VTARTAATLACVSAATALLGACGGNTTQLDARGATLLRAQIAAARDAAVHGDDVKTMTLLRAIDDSVDSLRRQDLVSDQRAALILSAVGDVEDALRSHVAARVSAPSAPRHR
jgi:hypothetical protein